MTHQWDLGVGHIGVGKVVDVAFRLRMPHQDDAPWQDAMISGSCTSAHTTAKFLEKQHCLGGQQAEMALLQ